MEILDDLELTPVPPIVNVASVRHLSPFRYPGGKTWLVPTVLRALNALPHPPKLFVDPFVGGGSVPLAAVIEGNVAQAVLCEKDSAVASVWKVVFSSDYAKLCSLISHFEISRESVLTLLSRPVRSTIDRAFQTIVRNRTFRGGILASGAGLVNIGENGRGVASRWYPETLIRRIRILNAITSRVTFIEGDGLELLQNYSCDSGAFIFVDPPYTAGGGKRAGSRLYEHSEVDHEAIFSALQQGTANFMMTYDDDLDVLQMSLRSGFVLSHVPMKSTHHRCMNELLITRA